MVWHSDFKWTFIRYLLQIPVLFFDDEDIIEIHDVVLKLLMTGGGAGRLTAAACAGVLFALVAVVIEVVMLNF